MAPIEVPMKKQPIPLYNVYEDGPVSDEAGLFASLNKMTKEQTNDYESNPRQQRLPGIR